MQRGVHSSVRGACCLDIGFRHMFSALGSVAFGRCICRAVRLPPYVYADASPGVGSLVGGELSQSLGARLLVSVLYRAGATCKHDLCCITLDNLIISFIAYLVQLCYLLVFY